MKPGCIIFDEQRNTGRRWAVAAGFAVAAAAGLYAALGADTPPEQNPDHSNQKRSATRDVITPHEVRPRQVWGHVAEMDANGQQKPTNDMWGLLLRATNEANQVQDEADRKHSAAMNADDCKRFWLSRMRYADFMNEGSAARRWETLLTIGYEDRQYLFGGTPTPEQYQPGYSKAYHETGRRGLEELKTAIRNNPEDHIGNLRKQRDIVLIYDTVRGLPGKDEYDYPDYYTLATLPAMRQAYMNVQKYLQTPSYAGPVGHFGYENFKDSIEVLRNLGHPEQKKYLADFGLNEEKLAALIQRSYDKMDEFIKSRDEKADIQAAQFRKDYDAPCP